MYYFLYEKKDIEINWANFICGGIVWVMLAVLCFFLSDSFQNQVEASQPPPQITELRADVIAKPVTLDKLYQQREQRAEIEAAKDKKKKSITGYKIRKDKKR